MWAGAASPSSPPTVQLVTPCGVHKRHTGRNEWGGWMCRWKSTLLPAVRYHMQPLDLCGKWIGFVLQARCERLLVQFPGTTTTTKSFSSKSPAQSSSVFNVETIWTMKRDKTLLLLSILWPLFKVIIILRTETDFILALLLKLLSCSERGSCPSCCHLN